MKRVSGALALCICIAAAQEPARIPRGTVRATGEATVSAAPDEARINIGVTTQARNADEAASANARQADAVRTQLRGLLGPNADLKTINYSLTPNYSYPGKAAPVISGYTANNTVQVRIENLKEMGRVIDAVTQNGANTISGIEFTLKDEHTVRAEAIRRAAASAKANAEAIAQALGVRVSGVYSAETGEAVVPRVFPMARMQAARAEAPTPVEAGTIDVHATVTVTLEVAQ